MANNENLIGFQLSTGRINGSNNFRMEPIIRRSGSVGNIRVENDEKHDCYSKALNGMNILCDEKSGKFFYIMLCKLFLKWVFVYYAVRSIGRSKKAYIAKYP